MSSDNSGDIFPFPLSPGSDDRSGEGVDLDSKYRDLPMGESFAYESHVDEMSTLRIIVTRVPGGYLHIIANTCVFVPYE